MASLAHSACSATELSMAPIVVFSWRCRMVSMVTSNRPGIPVVVACCPHQRVVNRLVLNWGVVPIHITASMHKAASLSHHDDH